MKLKNPMLVVTDIDKSVAFYKEVLGLRVTMDFGANKTLTGGLVLQTAETYKDFIGKSNISFGGNHFVAKRMDVPAKFVTACMRCIER